MVQLQGPDPFAGAEAEMDISSLISHVMGTSEQCSSEIYINGDNELATCMEFDDDTWDQRFLESVGVQNDIENQDSDTEETDLPPPPPKIKSYHEALQSLKDVQAFLESHSFSQKCKPSANYARAVPLNGWAMPAISVYPRSPASSPGRVS